MPFPACPPFISSAELQKSLSSKIIYILILKTEISIEGDEKMGYAKWTLIVVGLIVLVMGIWGLAGTYAGVADPQWHAVLKIIVGLIAIAVGVIDKKQ